MALKDDIARMALQEERLRFQECDESTAWALGTLMRHTAVDRELQLVIEIRHRGRPLFYTALHGTSDDSQEWVRRKGNVAMRYHQSSYRVGLELAERGISIGRERGVDPIDYAPHGGSFPIHVIGTGVIGAVTVSGVPQRDDHNFVVEMLCEFLGVPHGDVRLGPKNPA